MVATRSSNRVLVILSVAVSGVIALQWFLSSLEHPLSITDTDDALKKAFLSSTPAPLPALPMKTHPSSSTRPDYYMVFSTSCSDQQHWESLVFFYHAYRVGQPGNVTRILSGCQDQQASEATAFFQQYIQPMSDRFHLHLTPDFAKVKKVDGKRPFKYMNKPYGLRHWMEHALGVQQNAVMPAQLADSIVMLLDPDMILLRPLVHDFTHEDVLWVEEEPATQVVRTGFPMGQQDGYLDNQWMKLNISHITNLPPGEYVGRPKWNEGKIHWNSGPPYLATVQGECRGIHVWCIRCWVLTWMLRHFLRHVSDCREMD